mmetsp:Transcript_8869/g.26888  ORF Transcript_8869/g.26888 Transcript_8869/m.26888 type:complete len:204 (+) Transcript_8869:54-665(+)
MLPKLQRVAAQSPPIREGHVSRTSALQESASKRRLVPTAPRAPAAELKAASSSRPASTQISDMSLAISFACISPRAQSRRSNSLSFAYTKQVTKLSGTGLSGNLRQPIGAGPAPGHAASASSSCAADTAATEEGGWRGDREAAAEVCRGSNASSKAPPRSSAALCGSVAGPAESAWRCRGGGERLQRRQSSQIDPTQCGSLGL